MRTGIGSLVSLLLLVVACIQPPLPPDSTGSTTTVTQDTPAQPPSSQPSSTTGVTYTVTALGGSRYRFAYTIQNASTASIARCTIIFVDDDASSSSYLNLVDVSASPILQNWDALVADPILPGVDFAGYFDSMAGTPAGEIAPGASLSGFAVECDWTGSSVPGPQSVQLYDLDGALLFSGSTQLSP